MLRKQHGQGMTEYIVIVALIAIASIGVFLFLGWGIREQQVAITQELAGQDGTEMKMHAQASGRAAAELGKKNKGLDNYMLEHDRN